MQECLDNVIVVKSYNNEDLIKEQLVLKQEQYFRAKVKQNTISNLSLIHIYTSKEVNEEDNSEKDNEADIPWDFVE